MAQVEVKTAEVTKADLDAMRHKMALETVPEEVGRYAFGDDVIVEKRSMIEIFEHTFQGEKRIYNIRAIKDAIYTGSIDVGCVEITLSPEVVEHTRTCGGVESWRVEEITAEDIERPGIGVLHPDHGFIQIDGNHRLVAAFERFQRPTVRVLVIMAFVADLFVI